MLILVGVVLVLGAIETVQYYVSIDPDIVQSARGAVDPLLTADIEEGRGDWAAATWRVMPSWLLLAGFVPLIFATCRRIPLQLGRRQSLVFHACAAALFAFAHLAAIAAVNSMRPGAMRGFEASLVWLLSRFFVYDMLTYAAIAGVWHAVNHRAAAREREAEGAELVSQLADARLQALRGQLSPHFIFNTLNGIAALAWRGERNAVVETLNSLSELLRIVLDAELPQEIPLGRELELARSYLAIQQIRLGERLAWTVDAPPNTHELLFPAMLLQPLMENAIAHGVARNRLGGVVRVDAERDADQLVLRVSDSGTGRSTLAPNVAGMGIGLSNTRERLATLYGTHQELRIEHSEVGTTVHVRIPARTAPAISQAHRGGTRTASRPR